MRSKLDAKSHETEALQLEIENMRKEKARQEQELAVFIKDQKELMMQNLNRLSKYDPMKVGYQRFSMAIK